MNPTQAEAMEALIALDYMLVACGLSPKMGDGTPCYDLIHKHINVASVATETLRTERDELRNMWDIQQDALEEKWQVAASEQEAIAQAKAMEALAVLDKLPGYQTAKDTLRAYLQASGEPVSDGVTISRKDAVWFAEILAIRLAVSPDMSERARLNRIRQTIGGDREYK